MAGDRRLLALGLVSALVLLFAQATSPAEPSDPVVLAAGDIADCNATADSATADLLDSHAGTLLTLGDHAYENGTAQEFAACYEPTWGRHKARTRPAPGNHEYHTADAAGYFGYFGDAAGPPGKGYHSFDLGSWHVVSLNSERDTGPSGAQVSWLQADLAATSAECVLAYWHKPRWTSGNYTDLAEAEHLWSVLYDAGADVVLTGHDHNYQRYPPLDKSGALDPARGIRSFVVGTGGRRFYSLRSDSRREAGNDYTWGVLELTLHPSSYDWRFLGVAGSTYTDSGSATCSSNTVPSPPPPNLSPPIPPPPTSPPASPPQPPSPTPPPTPPPITAIAVPAPQPVTLSPPSVPPPKTAAPPPLRIGRGPVRVSASGRGLIWLACRKGGPDCQGRVTVYRSPDLRSLAKPAPRRRTAVGFGAFEVRAGSARPVILKLNDHALERIARRGGMRGDLVAAPADGRPAASRSVRLVLVRATRS